MKKNNMLRIASVLLVAVLLSTCAISGAFAKYVTKAEGTDTSATVAKWDVTIDADYSGVFQNQYLIKTATTGADGNAITYSVDSATISDGLVVAPGTSGTFAGVQLSGKSEVALAVTYAATVTLDGFGTYCPVYFKVGDVTYGLEGMKDIEGAAMDEECANTGALIEAVQEAIGDFATNYAPGTDLSTATVNGISWGWAFENAGHDEDDTNLGKAAAAKVGLKLDVTVTQID